METQKAILRNELVTLICSASKGYFSVEDTLAAAGRVELAITNLINAAIEEHESKK